MEPCKFEEKIIGMGEAIVRIETKLDEAITQTTNHIIAGAKFRLAIVCSCIGLVGLFVGGIVKFAVNDYKVSLHETDIREIREQIYDLNYVKGRAEAVAEKKINELP